MGSWLPSRFVRWETTGKTRLEKGILLCMEPLKQRWKRIPASIRKPLILVIGLGFVIISPFTGILPGPGGIPIFLVGVAILATEFEWAERVRDVALRWVKLAATAWRHHKLVGTLLIVLAAGIFATISFLTYRLMKAMF
jgi:hypothetical protein